MTRIEPEALVRSALARLKAEHGVDVFSDAPLALIHADRCRFYIKSRGVPGAVAEPENVRSDPDEWNALVLHIHEVSGCGFAEAWNRVRTKYGPCPGRRPGRPAQTWRNGIIHDLVDGLVEAYPGMKPSRNESSTVESACDIVAHVLGPGWDYERVRKAYTAAPDLPEG